MTSSDQTLWCIRAGSTGQADELFLKQNRIALGWDAMGDLSKLASDRDAFRARVHQVYPDWTAGKTNNSVSQLFRFTHNMKPGDLVAFPCKRERQIYLGRIVGPYQFDPKPLPAYPHHRNVQWVRDLPRSHFSQGALYEAGAFLSLFKISTYADEFIAAIEGKAAGVPVPVAQDETIAAVATNIEDSTYDFIIKKLAKETKGHPFAAFVAHVLNTMGYKTRVSPEGPDGGVDIIAHKDELGFEPPIIKVQCKATEGSIGDPVVSSLYGKVDTDEYGLMVTLGTFTNAAKHFARSKPNLRLIDGEELVQLIFDHYEQFDSRYKGLLPMRRVYVPEPEDEGAE